MVRSILNWFQRQNRPTPERYWNASAIETRREMLQREGCSAEGTETLCSKRWSKLSEADRFWLHTPLLLASLEVSPGAVPLPDKLEARPPMNSGVEAV